MTRPTNGSRHSGRHGSSKAEIIEKHLFHGMSAQKLSRTYGVSTRDIDAWRDLVRQGLISFFSCETDKIKALCKELTLLKKELGEA